MMFAEIQNRISELVEKDGTTVDYLNLEKELRKIEGDTPTYIRPVRLAFLSSFTLQGLPEVVKARGIFHNLLVDTYLAPYNRFGAEIMNPESGLYTFKPNCIFFIVDAPDIKNQLEQLLSILSSNLYPKIYAKIVVANFVASKDATENEVEKMNNLLTDRFGKYRFRIFDFAKFLERWGKKEHWYTKYRELGDFRLAPSVFPELAEDLLGYAVAIAGNTRKCLVVDLDNTLWKGIAGEDGPEGIVPDRAIQKQLLELHDKGIVLAINSKNNEEDVWEVFEKNKNMILQKNHFAAWKINWERKDVNMEDLEKDLNLGADSFVFVDDDPLQRILVHKIFPEVAVLAPSLLSSFAGFRRWYATKEDARRAAMYTEEGKRNEFRRAFANMEEYLRSLKLQISVREANESIIPRVSQLTQKTNQFNLTTRRYTEDEIRNFLKRGGKIWTAELHDNFGEYGVIGVCMIVPMGDTWRVDNFLLSCRVLGRGVEQAFMAYMAGAAKRSGVHAVLAEFRPTKKNAPCETFLADQKFSLVRKEGDASFYEFSLEYEYPFPGYITLVG